MKKILVADDDSSVRFMLSETLEKAKDGYQVVAVSNGRDALAKFEETEFDLIITDFKMPLKNGVELVEAIRTSDDAIPVIMITAYGSDELRSDSDRLNVFRYLHKPLKIDEIRRAAHDALESQLSLDEKSAIEGRKDGCDDSGFDRQRDQSFV